MQSIWPAIFTFLGVFTLAIVSPGPNFVLVCSVALGESRRAGLLTALGVATGSGLFALAGLAGLLVLAHALPHFALVMRFAGGGYLVWLGFDMLRNRQRRVPLHSTATPAAMASTRPLSAYCSGLLTNLTNPKAWAFYLSLFTLMMVPVFPLWGKIFLNAAMFLISFFWYAAVVLLICSPSIQPHFLAWRPLMQGLLGLLLMVLGGRILAG